MKYCCRCKSFHPLEYYHKDKSKSDGKCSYCKGCNKITSTIYYKSHSKTQGLTNKKNRYKKLYKFTIEGYNRLYKKQKGKCAICKQLSLKSKDGKLHIDHCHKSGKVRSLLCSKCNLGLGHFNDDIKLLKNAVNYLEKHNALL